MEHEQQMVRAAMAAKMQQRRSRQARRFERARHQALRDAERMERETAVRLAQQERFKYPELKRFASECAVRANVVPADGLVLSWLDLFCLVADEVPHSIMLVDMRVPGLPLAFCNRAAVALTGYDKCEMIGRNCRFMQGRTTQGAAVRAFS